MTLLTITSIFLGAGIVANTISIHIQALRLNSQHKVITGLLEVGDILIESIKELQANTSTTQEIKK